MTLKATLFHKLLGKRGAPKTMALTGLVILIVITVLIVSAPLVTRLPPSGVTLAGGFFAPYEPPSLQHLMGTNNIGQDLLTRVLYGGQVPLQIALLSTLLAGGLGITLGLMFGYMGRVGEKLVSTFMDSMYAFPGVLLAIAITSMLGPNFLNTAVALAVVYVPSFYRMTRGQTLQLKELPFVEAACSIGEPTLSILGRYIFPNVIPAIAVVSSLSFADAILIEAGLSFIGLPSVSPPTPEWGFDLVLGKSTLLSGSWWMITFPGLMIIFTVLGFSLLGEGLNELYNQPNR